MPTLTWLDSFQHQQVSAVYYGTNAGIYDTSNRTVGITSVPGRFPGSLGLQLVQDGLTSTRIAKVPATGTRIVVDSFYIRLPSGAPATTSPFWVGIATANGSVRVTNGGVVSFLVTGDTVRTINSVSVSDGLWHRVDIRYVSNSTTYTLDVQVDGVAGVQSTIGSTAADITNVHIGSTAAADVLTFQVTDLVRSYTTGDYPIGDHYCLALIPNQDGTHSWASTNMGPASGGVASSVSTLWQSVDDWPASAADYIQYANLTATSTEYAEILLPDVNPNNPIWGARAIAAIQSASTAANSATTRVVDGAGATALGLYTGDQSDTSLRHQAALVPSITTAALLNALKFRVGFPTDSNPAPQWAALMIDYAGPGNPPRALIAPQRVRHRMYHHLTR